MKKFISTVAAVAVLGFVANAMATGTTTPNTDTAATKTVVAAPAKNIAAPATAATAVTGNSVTGQLVAMDPTSIKVKDLKGNQEWSLNVGTANVKTFKLGDKVVCTYDGATKTLKSIEMAK